jgi:transcriptional regulator with XRE-family HTH domain
MPKSLRSSQQNHLLTLLIEARHRAGLTQAVLAARLGRPQSFVAKYENGERRIDVVEFVALAEALGEIPAELFAQFLDKGKA